MKGKLIVIDGIDKTGKATQTALLLKRLKKEKIKAHSISFPAFKEHVMGALIKECLRGGCGDFLNMDPRVVSALYALDRFESRDKIKHWLKEGYVVIADRYTSANQIHQGGKLKNEQEQKAFLKWLDILEYKVLGLPRPDMVIHLELPVKISLKLSRAKRDVVEKSEKYYLNSARSAKWLARNNKNWVSIKCDSRGSILPKREIHERIWSVMAGKIRKK